MALAESLGKDNSNAWGNKCSGKQVDIYIPFLQIKGELVRGFSYFFFWQRSIVRMALAESLSKDNSNAWGNKCSGKQVDMYIPFLQIKERELVKGLSFSSGGSQ